jgi:hypothetical protein
MHGSHGFANAICTHGCPSSVLIRYSTRVALYRFRLDLPRRWPNYLALIVLIGVVGGISLGSLAGARRSESAFPAFLKSTNPSDIAIDVGTYNPKILREISRLPEVASIETYVSPNAGPVTKAGVAEVNSPEVRSDFDPVASVNGLFFNQDRVTILQGKLPDPHNPNEVMVNEFAAKFFGWKVGHVIRYGFFSNKQFGNNGAPTSASTRIFNLRITGIGVLNTEIVQDQIDKTPAMILTPALTRQLIPCCISYAWSGVKLRGGAADVGTVESQYLHLLPPGYPYFFHVTSVVENEAEQAVKPESVALAGFGLIAGLAALFIALQLIAQEILWGRDERDVMWFVGANTWSTSTDSLLAIGLCVMFGAVLMDVVAVLLSPLLIFGPVQSVIASHGFSFDWTVLGFGGLAFVLVPLGIAAVLNYRAAPGLPASRRKSKTPPSSSLARTAAAAGLPTSTVLGLRYALERGGGRTAAPVRSSIVASTLAMVVIVGTLTFGSSLNTLTSTPRLYGWNWSAMLQSDAGYGNVPAKQAAQLLNHDGSVAAWTGIYFDSLLFDGLAVPVVGINTNSRVGPALLSGHQVRAANQVVVGPQTLAQLHKQLGDTITVTGGSKTATVRIVGVATMPTVGIGFGLHLSIGSGAFLSEQLIPSSVKSLIGLPLAGPNAILVRDKSSTPLPLARKDLRHVVTSLDKLEGGGAGIQTFNDIRPAEVTNYKAMGLMPLFLAAGLGAGAIVALTLTLLSSVRRRRRDLALLKSLGLTRRQLASVVAWQSTVSMFVGVLLGVPIGIVFGRLMWNLFAHELSAIPETTVPGLVIGLVALGALVLANLIAVIPARRAARTPSSVVLKAE